MLGWPRALRGCRSSSDSFEPRTPPARATGEERPDPKSDPTRTTSPAHAGRGFIRVAALPDDVDRFGITDDDREKMGRYLSKSYLDRSPRDLQPDDEAEDEA